MPCVEALWSAPMRRDLGIAPSLGARFAHSLRSWRLWGLSCLACLAQVAACSSGPSEVDAPVDALERFLEPMDRSNVHEDALEEAFVLLDEDAQRALDVRAKQTALVSGREMEPWRMIAPGRFRLRFAPAQQGGMRATVRGDSATVRVVSDDGKSQVDVPMLKQGGRWRVRLDLGKPTEVVEPRSETVDGGDAR